MNIKKSHFQIFYHLIFAFVSFCLMKYIGLVKIPTFFLSSIHKNIQIEFSKYFLYAKARIKNVFLIKELKNYAGIWIAQIESNNLIILRKFFLN